MSYSTLISTKILASHLNDPGWIIIDCRFDLSDPDAGYQDYLNSHIPGAIYAHLDHDLSGPISSTTGRHPLPDPDELINRFSTMGIDNQKQVVVYDTTGGSFAARLWCLLRAFEHYAVAVLDGGFPKWIKEERPTQQGIETYLPTQFIGQFNHEWYLNADEVEQIRTSSDYRLVDARTPERYHGEHEPIDPVAGCIPGAINRFHGHNLNPDGTFLPPEQVREEFQKLLGSVSPDRMVVYCGSGVTSCHHLLAMEYAGLTGAKLYAGSWSEWIRDPKRPRQSRQ
jgi:thiosulfate/3-mercaptopyruvate sulfurtransferase